MTLRKHYKVSILEDSDSGHDFHVTSKVSQAIIVGSLASDELNPPSEVTIPIIVGILSIAIMHAFV